MYFVVIDKIGEKFDFRKGFFPRAFYYKSDARSLVKEVESKGGKAHIEKGNSKTTGNQ